VVWIIVDKVDIVVTSLIKEVDGRPLEGCRWRWIDHHCLLN